MKTNKTLLCLALFLLCGQAQTAFSATLCAMSNGYTDTNGLGGTGHTESSEEKGIGGTGISRSPDQSSAATKVELVGTIYDFGSICVNGLRVKYNAKTPIETSAGLRSAKALKLGQVVEVYATRNPGKKELVAQEISVESALIGPVTGANPQEMTLEVMGETLRVNGEGSVSSFKYGDRVRVSGLRDNQDHIVVTLVDRAEKKEKDMAYGILRRTGKDYVIGLTPVRFAKGVTPPEKEKVMTAEGLWAKDALLVTKLDDEENEKKTPLTYISLEGYVSHEGSGPSSAKICNELFDVSNLSPRLLKSDKRVIVTGVVDRSGKIVARTITPVPTPAMKTER